MTRSEPGCDARVGSHLPTAREVASVLFRQRVAIIASFLIVATSIIFYGVCFPSYRAEMKLLLRKGRVDPPVAPQPTALSEYSRYEVSEEEINSEVQLLQDVDVLRPVVIATGLSAPERTPWLGKVNGGEARIARAVRRLANRLEVMPVRKTRLISVGYESGDPEQAARVLRELSSVYLQKHQVAHRPAGESAFFQQQAEDYRKALDNAEGRLLGLIESKGTVSPALQRDLTLQKLTEVDANYRQISIQLSETEERIHDLRSHLTSLPARRTTAVQAGDNPELLQQLKSTLLNLELKRIELLTKYQPGYRLLQEVDDQIADTRAAIAAQSLSPVRQETTDTEPRYDWAAIELEKAEIEAGGLHARQTAAASLVDSYRSAAKLLGTQALEHEDLVRAAKVAEENYLLYLRKREEARIGDALDERGILNVALVEDPVVPALPKWSLTSVSVLAVLLGAFVSTGVGFAADYLEPGYRTPEELAVSLGVPVLASLPREAA